VTIDEEAVVRLLTAAGFEVADRHEANPRVPQLRPIPAAMHRRVSEVLERGYPDGLYRHQAEAMSAAINGQDVVLATATASGKSLVFMSMAAHIVSGDATSRVLALYPAKALIQDQLMKWRDFLEPLGIRFTYIDGDVPVADRTERLERAHVALLTPDVAHAWLMSNLHEPTVRTYLERLRLMILDEAHVYEGAFGTNMAFLLRRLQVASGDHQLICSTATLGEPANFVELLTGKRPVSFGAAEDGAPAQGKTILRATCTGRPFDATVQVLTRMAEAGTGRFLAFADSRRAVEQFVAATLRDGSEEEGPEQEDDDDNLDGIGDDASTATAVVDGATVTRGRVLPYRAGYEAEDRIQIQESLALGELAGVVATSALELGLDIGEIELVLLLDVPPSMKSFWQRIGRAGRRSRATCVVLDPRNLLGGSPGGLDHYLVRHVEPNWLYLENRYIQYAHALCAALELAQLGFDTADIEALRSLPADFLGFLDNELHPRAVVPMDLYPLKQQGQDDPHHEFAIRGGIEQDFHIIGPGNQPLGRVTYSQALREAFPGGVYYYMARPHRVWRLDHHRSEIRVRREKRYTTHPIAHTMVFPRFEGGTHHLLRSEEGFVAESEMQVSERVIGFVERRGRAKEQHLYAPGSKYSQRPLTRFFETTGVCWAFPARRRLSDQGAQKVLDTFALRFGVQERDLGIGVFHARSSPLGMEVQGLCIYDATIGSLRLTQRLAEHFGEVVAAARDSLADGDDPEIYEQLCDMADATARLQAGDAIPLPEQPEESTDEDWAIVVAPGEQAILLNTAGTREVEVRAYRYTPRGLVYELAHTSTSVTWTAPAETVRPIHGQTRLLRVNLVTGESIELT
jgi:DEAD/DEAH box helicase domain-containing protein